MQQREDMNSVPEIGEFAQSDCRILSAFQYLLANIRLQGISGLVNNAKSKGVKPLHLFRLVFVLPFVDLDNVHQLMRIGINEAGDCKKDTIYRFLNNPAFPWRKIHHSFFIQVVSLVKRYRKTMDSSTKPSTPPCFIIDDTLFPKTGKAIEKIGKVFDHITSSHKLGIKALLSGWWDGRMFLPFDLSLHHEPRKNQSRGMKKKELDKQYSKSRNVLTPAYCREKELETSKIKSDIRMPHKFMELDVECRYVLADSWFTCQEILESIKILSKRFNRDLDYIGLINMNRVFVSSNSPQNRRMSTMVETLNRKRKPTRCRKLKCNYHKVKGTNQGIQANFFFIRMNGNSNWKCMICTDTSLSFAEAMKIYSVRWTIEVFFKDAKQNLNPGKCQSNDFDAHIATNTLSCLNYMALAKQKRFSDYETIGHLFKLLLSSIFSQPGLDWHKLMKNLIVEQKLLEKLYLENNSIPGNFRLKPIGPFMSET